MAAKANSTGIKDVLQQVQPMIESVAGFVVGNLAINVANKALKIDPTNTSEKGIKRVLPPLAVAAGAMFGSTKVKQPMLKSVLQGAAIAGAYKTAKALMPTASFLNGDGLGLTPVSAVSNTDRWLYHEAANGYYIDPPAYMGASEPEQPSPYFQPARSEQFYGNEDDLSGNEDETLYGDDEML